MRAALILLTGILGACSTTGRANAPSLQSTLALFRERGGFARQLSRGGGAAIDISLDEAAKPFGSTHARGHVGDAARQVAAMRKGFRTCYQRALMVDPQAYGTARLVLNIDQDGTVVAVKAMALRLPPTCVDCLLQHAIAGRFQPPESGHAVIAVPLTFIKQLAPSP